MIRDNYKDVVDPKTKEQEDDIMTYLDDNKFIIGGILLVIVIGIFLSTYYNKTR
tara:strand:- start:1934 stop:2095 length:162 start_codon:yes stop_codon:yes gene_type:complete